MSAVLYAIIALIIGLATNRRQTIHYLNQQWPKFRDAIILSGVYRNHIRAQKFVGVITNTCPNRN